MTVGLGMSSSDLCRAPCCLKVMTPSDADTVTHSGFLSVEEQRQLGRSIVDEHVKSLSTDTTTRSQYLKYRNIDNAGLECHVNAKIPSIHVIPHIQHPKTLKHRFHGLNYSVDAETPFTDTISQSQDH